MLLFQQKKMAQENVTGKYKHVFAQLAPYVYTLCVADLHCIYGTSDKTR
jgi:hypothetical protein